MDFGASGGALATAGGGVVIGREVAIGFAFAFEVGAALELAFAGTTPSWRTLAALAVEEGDADVPKPKAANARPATTATARPAPTTRARDGLGGGVSTGIG